MDIDVSEVLRYLKADGNQQTLNLISEVRAELEPMLRPKKIMAVFNLVEADGGIGLWGTEVILKGNLIKKTFGDCSKVYIAVATLGMAAERQMAKYSSVDMAKAVVADAYLTTYIEAYLDKLEAELLIKETKNGNCLKNRISCGYGDFSILYQRQIIDMLNAEKLLGIKLNDSNMLVPNKTVTALIGVCSVECKNKNKGCDSCNFNCGFRR
jgi:hypothetical protein